MSDSEDSTVTYTEDPHAYVEAALQAPPSPDYMFGPEHPPTPEFVLERVYPEFMPLEDDDDEDPNEDPVDYPIDRDDGDEEEESSKDDTDDEEEDEEKEEEEHPALADFVPPHVHRVLARMIVRAQTPISLPSEIEVDRLRAIHTLPPTPLSPWSSPLPRYYHHYSRYYHHHYL
nr:hypothetical protein [Tanacetum cinerariifolium]